MLEITVAVSVFGLFYLPQCVSQVAQGGLNGAVTDPSGGVLAGCNIKVESTSNGTTRSVQTNASGLYSILQLQPGSYTVTAQLQGFKTATAPVAVAVGTTVTLDFRMELGSVSENVNVSAQSGTVALAQDSHQISTTLASDSLQAIPVNGQNFLSIAATAPGVQSSLDSIQSTDTTFYKTGVNQLVTGGQGLGTVDYLLDGVINLALLSQSENVVPSIESIQEVVVEQNGMSARFGNPGVVNVVTKSGSNSVHGQAYDFLQNDAFNARNYFAVTVPTLRYNQFGANVGAPIIKNRLFAFFDYSGLRENAPTVVSTLVPTAQERQGNFQADGITIYDPLTYNPTIGTISPFPNDTIPAARISEFATKFLPYFPLPTGPTVNGVNFQENTPNTTTQNQYLGRIDYTPTEKDTIYGEIIDNNAPITSASINGPTFNLLNTFRGVSAFVQDIHTFSPMLLNTARVGYNRSVTYRILQGAGSQDFATYFMLGNIAPNLDQSEPPSASISGCCSAGDAFSPQGATQNLFQYSDEVNWTRGPHQFFFGAELDRIQFKGGWVIWNNGQYNFSGQYTSNHLSGTDLILGPGLADFLLGFTSSADGGIGDTQGDFREWDTALYFQDNWKINAKLTVNLGLRYQYDQPSRDITGHASVYDLATQTRRVGPWNANHLNFSPRLGFAYSLNPATVLRGGYGIYFSQHYNNELQFTLANPPNYSLQTPVFPINQLVPVEDAFTGAPGPSGLSPFIMSTSMPTPYTNQWNLNIQRSLGADYLATIAYVGNAGHHLPVRFNPNQAAVDSNPANPTPVDSRRPYPSVGDFMADFDVSWSNYNALQASLQKSFTNGLLFLANYTYSRSLNISDTTGGNPENGLYIRSSYGPANFDRPNVFKLSGAYELPFGTGKPLMRNANRLLDEAIGGWQASGFMYSQSGNPFTVNATDLSNTGSDHDQFANRSCKTYYNVPNRSVFNWFNTSCFAQPPVGTLGTYGRDYLRAPRNTNVDFSVIKRFPITEKRWLEFHADAFSVFNHPLFSTGDVSITDPTFGQIRTAAGSRVLQFALKVVF
jgi:outer membrane receptor protein involved in Fe transport